VLHTRNTSGSGAPGRQPGALPFPAYDAVMTDTAEGAGPGAAPPATDGDGAGAPDWGRLLDAAGIVAGVILLVILADIWTDGRLVSRHLRPRGEGDTGDDAG